MILAGSNSLPLRTVDVDKALCGGEVKPPGGFFALAEAWRQQEVFKTGKYRLRESIQRKPEFRC